MRAARGAGHGGQGAEGRRAGRHRLHRCRRRLEVPVHRGVLGHPRRGRGTPGGPTVGMSAFDEATAVTPDGDGWYGTRPDRRFAIVSGDGSPGAVNGGVLLATVLRAVLDTSPHPDPVATSAHFLRVPRLEEMRAGRDRVGMRR